MPEGWVWDETLFAGSSEFYDRGRLPYPPGLRDAFAAVADLRGSPRLIDVGCGPGTVALRLADLFTEPGGALVHVGGHEIETPAPEHPLAHPPPPASEIRRLKQAYLGPESRAGQGILLHGTPGNEWDVLRLRASKRRYRPVLLAGRCWSELSTTS